METTLKNVLTAQSAASPLPQGPAKKSPDGKDDGFAAELLGASLLAQAQAQVPTPAALPKAEGEAAKVESQTSPTSSLPTGKDATTQLTAEANLNSAGGGEVASAIRDASVARAAARTTESSEPRTLASLERRSAGSLNTAADLAGLKPWSRDWVMEGNFNRGPEAKTLFGGSEAPTPNLRGESTNPADLVEKTLTPAQQQALAKMTSEMSPEDAQALRVALVNADVAPAAAPKPQLLSGSEYLGALAATRAQPSMRNAAESGMQGGDSQSPPSKDGKFRLIEGGALGAGAKGRRAIGGDFGLEATGASALAVPAHAALHPASVNGSGKTLELNGQVVQGAMSRNRLSTDAMVGLSSGVRELSQSGGGEIRLRLNPNNMGEITMKVMTDGRHVGLQIQASDDRAKRVIEESIGTLKESLAQQQLTLGAVDLTVARGPGLTGGQDFSSSQNSQQGQSQSNDGLASQGWNLNQGSQQQQHSGRQEGSPYAGSSYERQSSSVASASAPMAAAAARARASASVDSGRLDVIA